MYTHHVCMYMYLALMAMSYMYRYSMCAIRNQSTDICITLRVHTESMKQGRELFFLSLQHFITSPIVFSHNLTLLLSLTSSFHYILPPNIDGYILKQRQVYCIYCIPKVHNIISIMLKKYIHTYNSRRASFLVVLP